MEYGKAEGELIIRTEDAIRRNSLFDNPQSSLSAGDASSMYSSRTYATALIVSISCIRCHYQVRQECEGPDRVW